MKSLPKPLLLAILAIIVLTAGSLFLIRSCIFGKGGKGFGGAPAGMREEYAKVPALYLEKDGKGVVISIEEHLRIHSWTKRGNSVVKRASTTFYLQSNDAATATVLKEVKLKAQSDIKYHPVEVMGVSADLAWIFIGEPMAFDGFTLEKKADISILEEKNKALTGKFPAERRYYRFDPVQKTLFITATDGSKWKMDTRTFLAVPASEEEEANPLDRSLAAVEKAEKQYQADMDSLYQQKNRRPSDEYAKGRISQAEYQRTYREYNEERKKLFARRDSLQQLKREIREEERSLSALENSLEDLAKGSPGYTELKTNQDTMAAQWFGLYSKTEWNKLSNRFQKQSENDETARRQLFIANLAKNRNGQYEFDKETAISPDPPSVFLHGGFLLNRQTASPIHLPGGDFLVIHREQIGRDAKLLISRVKQTGKALWTFPTGLQAFADFFYNGRELLLMGTDNSDLSSGQINVLLSVNLQSGKGIAYDYYTGKITERK